MPIRYEWIPGQEDIIRVVIEGMWGWEEFYVQHADYIAAAIDTGRRVDFVMDFSQARGVVPPGVFKAIQQLAKMGEGLYKPRITVFVFSHALFRTVITTFMKLHPSITKHYRIVENVEAALLVIAKGREAEKGKP